MTFPVVEGTSTSLEDAANVTTHTIDLPANIQEGELLILLFAMDGAGVSVSGPSGWSTFINNSYDPSAATLVVRYKQAGASEPSSVTITTGNGQRSAHCVYRISGAEPVATQPPEGITPAVGTSTAPDPTSVTPTGGAKDYLWIAGYGADRDRTTDGYPTDYNDNQLTAVGGGANSAGCALATRNLNTTNQDPDAFTISASDEWGAFTIAVHPLPDVFTPEVDAFRFYSDGTESGSSPKAAQDIDITLDATGDAQFHLRYRVQETGGLSGASTDDYALQVNKNSGGFVAVTASSSDVQSDTASSLTADGATTNRGTNGITDGTGSFVAGEQEETNGVIEDRQLTADNFTEHVWACKLIDTDLGDGDTLDFRVTLNAGSPGMTNSVTPRLSTPSFGHPRAMYHHMQQMAG